MASDIGDAIERALTWLRDADGEPCSEATEAIDALARLGPASVGLAVALRDILAEEDAWTGVSETVLDQAEAKLAAWAVAVSGDADGA